MTERSSGQSEKPSTTLPGTVEKIIKPSHPSLPEKAQIAVEGGEDLYREIRIDNVLKDEESPATHPDAVSRVLPRMHPASCKGQD